MAKESWHNTALCVELALCFLQHALFCLQTGWCFDKCRLTTGN